MQTQAVTVTYGNLCRKAANVREGQCTTTIVKECTKIWRGTTEMMDIQLHLSGDWCTRSCCKSLAAEGQPRKPAPFSKETQQGSSAAPPPLDNTGGKQALPDLRHVSHKKVSLLQVTLSCRMLYTTRQYKKWHNQKSYKTNVKWWCRECDTEFYKGL